MSTDTPIIPRPRLALRVGITGTRKLASETQDRLRAHVEEALGRLRERVVAVTADARARAAYDMNYPPLFRAISPLAVGADRLFAKAALAYGFQLEVPLPFAQSEYEMDSPGTVEEFRSLLAQASQNVLVLDGGYNSLLKRGEPDPLRDASYEAVGRFVVRNSDLIIAIWDGKPANGRGGTAEIVKFATEHAVPVLWFPADGVGERRWIDNPHHLRHPKDHACGEAAYRKLDAYLEALFVPATFEPGEDIASFFVAPNRANWLPFWGAYRVMMKVLTLGLHRGPGAEKQAHPVSGVWRYWDTFFRTADTLAVQCAARYRSSFVLVVLLAAVTTVAAVAGMSVEHWARQAAVTEFILLSLIGCIVRLNVTHRWHKGLISYRLLAELIRDQQALGVLGWSLPLARSHSSVSETSRGPLLAWYFNAIVRVAPCPQGELTETALAAARDFVVEDLIAGQLSYHKSRRAASEMASERLAKGSKLFFGLTVVFVLAKCIALFAHWDQGGVVLDFITVALPAISVALASIRSYAELEILIDQSVALEQVLTQSRDNLTHIARDLDEPLTSTRLGHEILRLAQAMQLETDGWAQLFRIKQVEAGG